MTDTATNKTLEELAADITSCGNAVKELKSSGDADPAAIKSAVDALLAAKRAYAAQNGGIGVDGKPFVEGKQTKAQKKAAAAAAKGDSAGPAKPVSRKKGKLVSRLTHVSQISHVCCWRLLLIVTARRS